MIIKNFAIIAMLGITLILSANLAWGQPGPPREACNVLQARWAATWPNSSRQRNLDENRQYSSGYRVGAPIKIDGGEPTNWHALRFKLVNQASPNSFYLNEVIGQIQTYSQRFDHEKRSSYPLSIEAWLLGSPKNRQNPSHREEYCNERFTSYCGDCRLQTITVNVRISDEPESPPRPQAPRVTGLHGFLTASWNPVAINPEIISHDVQYRIGALGPFKNGPQGVIGTSATIENLESRFNYQVRIRATNSLGDSPWSANTAARTTPPLAPPPVSPPTEPPPVSPLPIGPPPVSTPPVSPPVQNPPVDRPKPVPKSGPRWRTHAQPEGVTPVIYVYGVDLTARSWVHFQWNSAVIKLSVPMRIELVDGLSTHEFALCAGYSGRTIAPSLSRCTETFLDFPVGISYTRIWVIPKEPLPAEGGSWVLAAYRIPEDNGAEENE